MKNKAVVILSLAVFVFIGIAASKPTGNKERNLKVLPKDISNADLDSVMEGFVKSLNVTCDFCHAESKTIKDDIDYASDDKPEKEITRIMMKMTASINKDYFDYTIIYKAGEIMAVSCYTCHDGFPRPDLKHEKKD
ncbi:MAG TPA: c-type cytochrome [Chitinophagaceae bacterium]|nr:c-type cytochrome [Chitinophagaceae bacterium]